MKNCIYCVSVSAMYKTELDLMIIRLEVRYFYHKIQFLLTQKVDTEDRCVWRVGCELLCAKSKQNYFFQEKLHSVKWYRIDYKGHMQEFYSYKPGNIPPAKRHLLTGIKVDVSFNKLFYIGEHVCYSDAI